MTRSFEISIRKLLRHAPPSIILVDQPKIGKQAPISPLSPGQLPSGVLTHLFLWRGSVLFTVACSAPNLILVLRLWRKNLNLVRLCGQAIDLVKAVIFVEALKIENMYALREGHMCQRRSRDVTSIPILYLGEAPSPS